MDGISATLALKALDGLMARAEATSENIANANTPGYRPLRVSFEEALAAAAKSELGDIENVQPRTYRDPSGAMDGELRLDLELATASGTAARYAALVEVLNRQLQLRSLAATGGR